MGRFLYLLLVQASLFSIGVSSVTIGVLLVRRPPRWYGYALAKAGMAAVIGIILLLVLPQYELDLSNGVTRVWIYIGGVVAYGVGVFIVCRDILIRTSADRITKQSLRFEAVENRLTAEEKRNTGIEQFAEETRTRAAQHGQAREDEHEHKEAP